MEGDFDRFLREAHEKIVALAAKFQVKISRVRYDCGFRSNAYSWERHLGDIGVVVDFAPENQANADLFKEQVTNLYKPAAAESGSKGVKINVRLNPEIKGIKCPPVTNAIPLVGMSQRKPIKPRKGEFTLLYFWNATSDRAVDYLETNDKMLESHPEWLNRLRVVEISTDKELESASKELKSCFWEKIDRYWLTHDGWAGLWTHMPDKAGPYYVFCDQDGYIITAGDPSWIDLETTIAKALNGEIIEDSYGDEEEEKRFNTSPVKDLTHTLAQYEDEVQKFSDTYRETIDEVNYTTFELNFYRLYRGTGKMDFYGEFCMRYNWYDKYPNINDKIVEGATKFFGDRVAIKQYQTKTAMTKVVFGAECEKCKKKLGECDQYMCVTCEDPFVHYCLDCLKPRDTAKKAVDMVHEHGFYFIQKDSKNVLDELKVHEIRITDISEIELNQRVTCCLCTRKETTIVWKCANCVDLELCNECFTITRNQADPKYAQLAVLAKKQHHDIKTHIYVREDFSGLFVYGY